MDERIKKADELMQKGKSSKAVSIIKNVLKEMPNDPYLYYLLGIAKMKCGRFFLAKQALERADQLLPRHADNLRSLGWVKVMLGLVEDGRNDLREAINLNLMNPLSYVDLAMSYFHFFDFKKGMEWLERGRALAPKESYVLNNLEMAKEMERDYLKCSAKEIKELKKRKLDPKEQLSLRIAILEKYSFKKPLTKDEAEEIREEARLNGVSISIVSNDDEKEIIASRKNNELKIKEILKKRHEIEKELSQILKETKSSFTIEDIKDIIYHEKGQDDLMKVIAIFDKDEDSAELNNILGIVNDAWNYFPHKSLEGFCPMEKILEYQQEKMKI